MDDRTAYHRPFWWQTRAVRGWRRWAVAAAVGLVTSVATFALISTLLQPEQTCACRGAPYLDDLDDTAARFVAAVAARDAATTWAMLTPEAQQRHGTADAFGGELAALADRFRSQGETQWHRVYERTQGYDTPSMAVLVLVSADGPKAVSGLVLYSQATRDDPGRVDPDLGTALQLTPHGTRMVDVANATGSGLRFVALVRAEGPPLHITNVGTGGGLHRLEPQNWASPPPTPVLVIAVAQLPDGRFAIGSAPVQF